jgi:hypothetical protein
VTDTYLTPFAFMVLIALWAVVGLVYYATRRKQPKPVPVPESIRHETCDLELCEQPAAYVYNRHPSGGRLYICHEHAAGVSEWLPRETPRDQQEVGS